MSGTQGRKVKIAHPFALLVMCVLLLDTLAIIARGSDELDGSDDKSGSDREKRFSSEDRSSDRDPEDADEDRSDRDDDGDNEQETGDEDENGAEHENGDAVDGSGSSSRGLLGGGVGGAVSSEVQAYILEGSELEDGGDTAVGIFNVAAILEAPDIPPDSAISMVNTPSTQSTEDWREQWRDGGWHSGLPVPSWLFDGVALDDLTTILHMLSGVAFGDRGYALFGNFPFDDLRDAMDDADWEEDSYLGFEVWDERNVALLEDSGVILLGNDYVAAVLEAMDAGTGLVDDESVIIRLLDKVEPGLQIFASSGNCANLNRELPGCLGIAVALRGGNVDTNHWSGAHLFSSSVVNLERGATTGWHTHESDQILVVTSGVGIVANETAEQQITVGDVVHIRKGENHWHGALSESYMSHITITAV